MKFKELDRGFYVVTTLDGKASLQCDVVRSGFIYEGEVMMSVINGAWNFAIDPKKPGTMRIYYDEHGFHTEEANYGKIYRIRGGFSDYNEALDYADKILALPMSRVLFQLDIALDWLTHRPKSAYYEFKWKLNECRKIFMKKKPVWYDDDWDDDIPF